MKVSIFGTKNVAEECYQELLNRGYEIGYVFDNYNQGLFHGHDIKKVNIKQLKEYIVIIAVLNYSVFIDIKKQLEEYGMIEFKDFYFSETFYKKIVAINANCYGIPLREYLCSFDDFKNDYFVYPLPPIYRNEERCINRNLLKRVSLFIYQDIQSESSYGQKLSFEYIKSLLGDKATAICIPNLVGMGKIFFPQCSAKNERNNVSRKFEYGLFPYKDELVEKMILEGKSDEDIIHLYNDCSLLSKEEIEKTKTNIIDEYKNREEKWDIKIINVIKDDIGKEKVFYDLFHPTNKYIKYIAEEILKRLGYTVNEKWNPVIGEMDAYEYPVLACVQDYYNVKSNNTIRNNLYAAKLARDMDLKEYVKEYRHWCFDNNRNCNI